MWFVLLAVIAAATASAVEDHNASPYIFESQVNKTINQIAQTLTEKDPAHITNIDLSFDNSNIRAQIYLDDITVKGFSKFRATQLKITILPPSMTFDLEFDDVHIMIGNYHLDGRIVFVPIYGNGKLSLRTTVLTLGGSAKVKIGSAGISSVSDLNVRFNLKESNLTITGLLDNEGVSEIVSAAVTEVFPQFVNTYGKRMGELISDVLERVLNAALKPAEDKYSFPLESSSAFEFDDGMVRYHYKV